MLKNLRKKLLIWIGLILLSAMLLFVLRVPIMSVAGNYLISEDELQKSEVIFVLGGSSFDRGNEAAKLFTAGYAPKIVCLGENIPTVFKAIDKDYMEAEVTRINIVKNNDVKKRHVELLAIGTSTKEESEAIATYCSEHELKRIIIISDKFHTRRIRGVFEPLFEDLITELIIHGTGSTLYNEDVWWEKEQGLIMVNNEYVKLFYYWLKY
ncbi:MAG: YdcF family protein [Flavobacteriales bacterium]|nr:YdcF family protein [Flavobacteriales bacterium]